VQARIVLWEGKEVLQVPLSSLFRSSGSWNVFVIDAGRARVRAVKTGQRSADQAEVTGGLREGERVVLHPANELQDGMRVKDR
jgi:HlyD family secretion protein